MAKKIKVGLSACFVLLLGVFGSFAYCAGITKTNTSQLPSIISSEHGRPTVVVFLFSGCPLSRNLWPSLMGLAKQVNEKDVAFLVFSTDKSEVDAAKFVSSATTLSMFYWIEPWSPGQLDASMKPTGIEIGKTFRLPLVAVLDRTGKVVAQWQGLQDMAQVENALKSIRAM